MAGVGQDAAEIQVRMIMDHPGQLPDTRILRRQAAPVQSHVDLQEHSDGLPMGCRPLARHPYALLRVGHHAHFGASTLHCGQQPVPLRRGDHRPGDGYGPEPAPEEDQRFVHRGHGDTRRPEFDLSPPDLQGLVGLGVGAQGDAVSIREFLHGAQIGHQPGLVEQNGGRFHFVEILVRFHGLIRGWKVRGAWAE